MFETISQPSRRQPVLIWSLWWIVLSVWTWMLLSSDAPHAVAAVVPLEDLRFWVAKCGHVTGYLVLTVIAGCLPVRRLFRVAWVLFLAGHACMTEWIQTFVPGRTGSVRDVGIDAAGITLGLLVLLAWNRWRGRSGEVQSSSAGAYSTSARE